MRYSGTVVVAEQFARENGIAGTNLRHDQGEIAARLMKEVAAQRI